MSAADQSEAAEQGAELAAEQEVEKQLRDELLADCLEIANSSLSNWTPKISDTPKQATNR